MEKQYRNSKKQHQKVKNKMMERNPNIIKLNVSKVHFLGKKLSAVSMVLKIQLILFIVIQ
jgi:membrane protein YqaA with SNARE-associated domain